MIYIEKNAFIGANKLTHLDLNGNLLKTFPREIISNLPVLKFLNLSNNMIKEWTPLESVRE